MTEETKPRKQPPTVMPTNPESLFLFLAHGEMYEGETEDDFSNRKATLDNLLASLARNEDAKPRIITEPSLINQLIKRI